jgi:hypothetical protein
MYEYGDLAQQYTCTCTGMYMYPYMYPYPYLYPESYEHVRSSMYRSSRIRSTKYGVLTGTATRRVPASDRIHKMYLVPGSRLRLCILLNPTEYKSIPTLDWSRELAGRQHPGVRFIQLLAWYEVQIRIQGV